MKRSLLSVALAVALAFLPVSDAYSANYGGRIVNILSGYLNDNGTPRNCTLVMLDTYGGWLALSHSHPSYTEIRAMILIAKTTNRSINIYTTGANASGNCTWEEINFVGYF